MTEPTRQLLAAQDGDPAAFEQFIRLTMRDVVRFCTYLAGPQLADDLVQDTYLRALRSLHTFRGDGDGVSWLISIARRACADAIGDQQRARRPELTRRPDRDHSITVEMGMLVDGLPEDQRQAFVLTQVLGYRYAEAAEICGCPIGTIRSRVARARAALVDELTAAVEGTG